MLTFENYNKAVRDSNLSPGFPLADTLRCLQCFDTVSWVPRTASGHKFSDEVLMWLSVWSKVK